MNTIKVEKRSDYAGGSEICTFREDDQRWPHSQLTSACRSEGNDKASCETTIGNSILGMRTDRAKARRQRFLGVLKE